MLLLKIIIDALDFYHMIEIIFAVQITAYYIHLIEMVHYTLILMWLHGAYVYKFVLFPFVFLHCLNHVSSNP